MRNLAPWKDFESTCYHPLRLFNREGDCLAAKLGPGNVQSAEGWEELLLSEIDRQQAQGKQVAFRADAAFAKPELYAALDEPEVKYAIRVRGELFIFKQNQQFATHRLYKSSIFISTRQFAAGLSNLAGNQTDSSAIDKRTTELRNFCLGRWSVWP
ncbi:MAG: transposase [Candidatus Binataceae bacterium]